MAEINPKIERFTVNGVTYGLRCNMNVLAEVQSAYGGDLLKALDGIRGLESSLVFLAAMLNDWADERAENGDLSYRKYTAKQLGRILTIDELTYVGETIFELVLPAVSRKDEEPEPDSKN